MDIGKLEIPESSGVYLMKKNNKVIYVGKAQNLKKRVSSYFNRVHESEKTNELVKNIEDIEFFLTNTETDALLLENNLIKKYSPKYNILLKDEKTYPFIKISKEDFPSIKIVRTTKALDIKSGEYFGPYPYGAWRLKNILMKLFKIRDCNRDMKKLSPRPCLKYYMKSCTGPCVYKDIKEEYNKNVENLKQVLRGNTSKLINELTTLMNQASQDMDFEKSIIYREQIKELKSIESSQIIQYERELDEDIFVFKTILDKAFICVLNMRDGKILGKSSTAIDLKNKITDNIYEAIFMSYYSKHILPKSLVLDAEYENELSVVVKALTNEENKKKEKEAFEICQQKIKKHKLDMNLLDVEYKFDNSKILFFFTADGRIDFRELVKDLAAVFKTRIELRQIGVRDEVKRIGGNGVCGRELCCCSFLGNFETVSIKMAKEQNISLNPSKISGNCGRLMCCLKYEQEAYEEKLKKLPNIGAIVKTPEGQGEVDGVETLKEIVKVKIKDGEIYKFKRFETKDIKVIKDVTREKTAEEEKEFQKELKELENLERKDSKLKEN